MNIAITGSTGFVGSHITRVLSKKYAVTAIKHISYSPFQKERNIKEVTASINDIDSLITAFKDIDIVIHLVGIIAETKTKTFEGVVTRGTKNVVSACKEAGVKKIIYISAAGTSSDAAISYFKTKYQAEQTVIASGLSYLILRHSVIYGKNDGVVSMVKKLITSMPFTPVIGSGRYILQPIYIDDLSAIVEKSIELPNVWNDTIDLAGPEPMEYVEIIRILKKTLHKKRLNIFIPMVFMKLIALLLEKIFKPSLVTVDQLIMLESGSEVDITKMKEFFSIEPVKFENGLKKYLR